MSTHHPTLTHSADYCEFFFLSIIYLLAINFFLVCFTFYFYIAKKYVVSCFLRMVFFICITTTPPILWFCFLFFLFLFFFFSLVQTDKKISVEHTSHRKFTLSWLSLSPSQLQTVCLCVLWTCVCVCVSPNIRVCCVLRHLGLSSVTTGLTSSSIVQRVYNRSCVVFLTLCIGIYKIWCGEINDWIFSSSVI